MLGINSVETVRVGRVKTTQSSGNQQLLSLPLSLEQTGIIFLGSLCWRGYWLCTRDSGSGFAVTLRGAADPGPVGSTHSFLWSGRGLCQCP